MSTDNAQRRLLEALAAQDRTSGGIGGLLIAMPFAIELADSAGEHALADVWRALTALSSAVQADLRKEATHG